MRIILGYLGIKAINKLIKNTIKSLSLNSKLPNNKLKNIISDIYTEAISKAKESEMEKMEKWKVEMIKGIEDGNIKTTQNILDRITSGELI